MATFRKVFTLDTTTQRLRTLIEALDPSISSAATEVTIKVESGGPIAVGDSSMAAVADGAQLQLGDEKRESAGLRDAVDTGSIYLKSTANTDKVAVMVRTR